MNEQVIADRVASSTLAGAGMSDSAFKAKVRSLLGKIAAKYGGTATGNGAIGTTADGAHWWAGIIRQNASNGEVAGILNITIDYADGRKDAVKTAFNWDQAFEKLGIPAVKASIRISSREDMIAEQIVAEVRPRFDGVGPEEYAAYWGSTKGQGAAHFYNYGSELQEKDSRFYYQFMNGPGGIKDTLKAIQMSVMADDGIYTQKDWDEMNRFAQFISKEAAKA